MPKLHKGTPRVAIRWFDRTNKVEFRRHMAEHNILEIKRMFCKEWALSHLLGKEYAGIDEPTRCLVVESRDRKAPLDNAKAPKTDDRGRRSLR
jgi:hypothetical protein